MHKMILKLTATGMMITALLAVVVITQGCDNTSDLPKQTAQPGYEQTLETTESGDHSDETTMGMESSVTEEVPVTQPAEQVTTGKPGIGQVIQNFFENIFGGDKNESALTATAPQSTGESTTQPATGSDTKPVMSIETMDYKTFRTLSSAEKVAFRNLFVDHSGNVDDEAFVIWFNEAKREYDDKINADSATGPFGIG